MSEWEIESQNEDTIVLKKASAGGGGALIFIWLIMQFIEWVKENSFYIISIAVILFVCVIICLIIFFKSTRPGFKIVVTIAIAIGLVFLDIRFGTEIQNFLFKREQLYSSRYTEYSKKMYGYVHSNRLNLREGPDVSYQKIISIPKDARVSIIDNSGTWYKVQYNDIIGYVNSKYLYVEE